MFHAAMREAVEAARTLAQADDLSRRIWQAHAAEAVTDDEAQALAEQLHARRNAMREAVAPVGIPLGRVTFFPKRRLQRAPERSEAIARRRHLACSGPMPPQLAARFTTGQLAVLKIVGDEFARHGACGLCIDAIAARAGVCRRLAQGAIRLAEGDGLLTIQERRHQGHKSDPNIVRIICREWLAWIKRGSQIRNGFAPRAVGPVASATTGCKPMHPTGKGDLQTNLRASEPKEGCRGQRLASTDQTNGESARVAEGAGPCSRRRTPDGRTNVAL